MVQLIYVQIDHCWYCSINDGKLWRQTETKDQQLVTDLCIDKWLG